MSSSSSAVPSTRSAPSAQAQADAKLVRTAADDPLVVAAQGVGELVDERAVADFDLHCRFALRKRPQAEALLQDSEPDARRQRPKGGSALQAEPPHVVGRLRYRPVHQKAPERDRPSPALKNASSDLACASYGPRHR